MARRKSRRRLHQITTISRPIAIPKPATRTLTRVEKGAADPYSEHCVASEQALELKLEHIEVAEVPRAEPSASTVVPPPPGTAMVTPYWPPLPRTVTQAS